MPETTPQPAPTQPAPQAMPLSAEASSVVVPPEPPKKGHGLLWLVVVLAVVILGGGAYFLYTVLQKPPEETSMTPPRLATQESKPDQGFDIQPSPPAASTATPTLTSSDSVSDIEKDLSGTTLEEGNSSEFDADLQSL